MNRDVENDNVTDKIETAMMQMKNMDENMVVDYLRIQLPKNGCSGDLKLFKLSFDPTCVEIIRGNLRNLSSPLEQQL